MSWLDIFRPKNYNPNEEKQPELPEDEIIISSEGESKESDEPWVEIKGKYDPEHGMVFTTDWNSSFIKELRKYGYEGTEEQIMQQYLLLTYKNIIEKEEQEGKQIE